MGMAGGCSEFSEHTDLVYSFSLDFEMPQLDVAVILRSACPIRELGMKKPETLPPIRPLGAGSGGGQLLPDIHFFSIGMLRNYGWMQSMKFRF